MARPGCFDSVLSPAAWFNDARIPAFGWEDPVFIGNWLSEAVQNQTGSDNFNRANAATLGPNWTTAPGWTGTLGITSNTAALKVTGKTVAVHSAGSYGRNQWSKVTYRTPGNADPIGPAVRGSLTAADGYVLYGYLGGGFLYRIQGGFVAQNFFPAGIPNWSLADGDVLLLGIVGNNLRLFKNGVEIVNVTDDGANGGVIASGVPGIFGDAGLGVDTVLDDFAAGTYADAAAAADNPSKGRGTWATDDFNRPDAASLGANWTTDAGGFNILSNKVAPDGVGAVSGRARYTANGQPPDDQYAEIKVAAYFGGPPFGTGYIEPTVRMTPGAPRGGGYYCEISNAAGYRLWRVSDGTLLASSGINPVVGDVLRVEAVGSSILVKLNGLVICGPVTDTDSSSGWAGLNSFGSSLTDVQGDDFKCGQIVNTPTLVMAPAASAAAAAAMAATNVLKMAPSVSAAAAAAATPTPNLAIPVAASAAGSPTATATPNLAIPVAVSSAAAAADSAALQLVLAAALTGAANAGHSITTTMVLVASLAGGASAAATAIATAIMSALLSGSGAAADSVAGGIRIPVSLSDGVAAAASADQRLAIAAALSAAAAAGDTRAVTLAISAALASAVSAADARTLHLDAAAAASASANADASASASAIFSVTLTAPAAAGEEAIASLVIAAAVTDVLAAGAVAAFVNLNPARFTLLALEVQPQLVAGQVTVRAQFGLAALEAGAQLEAEAKVAPQLELEDLAAGPQHKVRKITVRGDN